jgi:hypothetical protein
MVAGQDWIWSGTISATTSITATLTVELDSALDPGTVIENVAEFAVDGTTFTKHAETTIWGDVFLPLVWKG